MVGVTLQQVDMSAYTDSRSERLNSKWSTVVSFLSNHLQPQQPQDSSQKHFHTLYHHGTLSYGKLCTSRQQLPHPLKHAAHSHMRRLKSLNSTVFWTAHERRKAWRPLTCGY